MLQFFNFQKSAYGDKLFTVNIAIRSLYIPSNSLILQPGNRIGYWSHDYDHWWSFISEDNTEKSFIEINGIVMNSILPMFDVLATNAALVDEINDHQFPGLRWTVAENWKYNDLGFLYLKLGNLEKAEEMFIEARRFHQKLGFDWAIEAAKICDQAISAIKRNSDSVNRFLNSCKKETQKKLGLLEWEAKKNVGGSIDVPG